MRSKKGLEALKEYREGVKSGLIIPKKREIVKRKYNPLKAIKLKCKDCCCDYVDGQVDCEIEDCSLYEYMPYGKFRKNRKVIPNVF